MVTEAVTTKSYTHTKPGTNIAFGIAGFYTPLEEIRLKYKNREVFYITGKVTMEASCCKMAPDWIYAIVPGYIVDWHNSVNEAGENISVTEPVRDQIEKDEIRKIITSKEDLTAVDFW